MEPQGFDRNALIGILLMSLLLGVWMVYTAPTREQAARQQTIADSTAATEARTQDASPADALDALDAVLAALILLSVYAGWRQGALAAVLSAVGVLAGLVTQGKLRYRETVVDGFENAPAALRRLFDGSTTGKLVVRVDPTA